jgi:L-xylulokinase
MNADLYIGIDIGSSRLKAVAIDAGSGQALATSGVSLDVQHSADGGCQFAAAGIKTALQQSLSGVVAQLGERAASVRALGCTGHGAGLYALDADGELASGFAVCSTDQRAAARVAALTRQHGTALFEDVGCAPWAGQPTMIGAELRQREPQRLHGVRHLLFAKDYLAYLLTGEVATDFSDASTAGLVTLASGGWSTLAFQHAGLPDWAGLVPAAPVTSGTVIGRLRAAQAEGTGLRAGLPVAVGAIDLLAGMNGAGATGPGEAVAVFGTWCVNAVIGPVIEPKPAVGGIVHFGRPGQRLYLENSPASMANLAWLAATLQFPDARSVIDAAFTAPPLANGLRFIPFLHGASAPSRASAAFLGLKGHHSRADMARAVVEAVVALHAWHLRRLESGGVPVTRVYALGGGARDPRLARLLATMLARPVQRVEDDETGARGAALYAALSDGVALGGSGSRLLATGEAVAPLRPEIQAYAEFRAGFDALIDGLTPLFARLGGVTHELTH